MVRVDLVSRQNVERAVVGATGEDAAAGIMPEKTIFISLVVNNFISMGVVEVGIVSE